MSLFVDKKYLGLVSPKLKLFKQKNADTFTFRCPFCLDSKKSKTKTRGYIFAKKNDLYFKCFNCGRAHTFGTFLKHLDPNLHKQYTMDRFKNGENGKSNYKKPNVGDQFKTSQPKRVTAFSIPSILELPEKHFAREYAENFRKLPKEFLPKLYYATDFRAFIKTLLPDTKLNLPNDQRLVIPFYDKESNLLAVQGRALNTSNLRYITVKMKEEYPKVFGLDRLDPNKDILVLEGPFDSMFLDNAIAGAGGDLPTNIRPQDCTFIYDNEPRSKETCKKMEKIIDKGYRIVIWPERFKEKDVNELVQNHPETPLDRLFGMWTYAGLAAKMKFGEWRKV